MTLVSQLITDAYRESNIIAEGATESTQQQTDALARLQSLVDGMLGREVGERIYDWPIGFENRNDEDTVNSWTAYDWVYPVQNTRLVLDHTSPQTIYFPADPDNGARMRIIDPHSKLATYAVTLNGNGRTIEGTASVQPLVNSEWLYNADTGNWEIISALTTGGQFPLPAKYDDYFIIRLAARMNPRYGRSLDDLSLMRLQEMQEQIDADFNQIVRSPVPTELQRLSTPHANNQGYNNQRGRFGWRR